MEKERSIDGAYGVEDFQSLQIRLRKMLLEIVFGEGHPTTRYSALERLLRQTHRRVFPVPKSPWTNQPIDDVTEVNLVPPENLEVFFSSCIELLRKFKGGDLGDYLEFGVFNGSSMASMSKALEDSGGSMRRFGFDAFEGLPDGAEHEDDGVWKKGFYACSFEDMQRGLRKKNINPDEITWVKGWYNETLKPELAKAQNIDNVGIAFIDCDTYSSAKSVLDFLAPLIDKPAILVFDDWKLNDLDVKEMGEYRAFNEFLSQNPHLHATEIASYNRKSKAFLVTPKLQSSR